MQATSIISTVGDLNQNTRASRVVQKITSSNVFENQTMVIIHLFINHNE